MSRAELALSVDDLDEGGNAAGGVCCGGTTVCCGGKSIAANACCRDS